MLPTSKREVQARKGSGLLRIRFSNCLDSEDAQNQRDDCIMMLDQEGLWILHKRGEFEFMVSFIPFEDTTLFKYVFHV